MIDVLAARARRTDHGAHRDKSDLLIFSELCKDLRNKTYQQFGGKQYSLSESIGLIRSFGRSF